VTLVRAALTNNVAAVLSQSVMFVGSLALMLALNWRLTLFYPGLSAHRSNQRGAVRRAPALSSPPGAGPAC